MKERQAQMREKPLTCSSNVFLFSSSSLCFLNFSFSFLASAMPVTNVSMLPKNSSGWACFGSSQKAFSVFSYWFYLQLRKERSLVFKKGAPESITNQDLRPYEGCKKTRACTHIQRNELKKKKKKKKPACLLNNRSTIYLLFQSSLKKVFVEKWYAFIKQNIPTIKPLNMSITEKFRLE